MKFLVLLFAAVCLVLRTEATLELAVGGGAVAFALGPAVGILTTEVSVKEKKM